MSFYPVKLLFFLSYSSILDSKVVLQLLLFHHLMLSKSIVKIKCQEKETKNKFSTWKVTIEETKASIINHVTVSSYFSWLYQGSF